MDYKYIILDFGNVLFYPKTGNWFATEKLLDLIDTKKFSWEEFNMAVRKYRNILARRAITLEDEYQLFSQFYQNVFREINYQVSDDILRELSLDFTYNFEKYAIYPDVLENLVKLARKYKLILLSDNWPCGEYIMRHYQLAEYFQKMYISSYYECLKKEGTFFDYPINEFQIKLGEALFIDDNEENLDVAVTKGMDVIIMMRDQLDKSKYEIIQDLDISNKLVRKKKMR